MILTIDIGNINVVVGCSKDDKFIFRYLLKIFLKYTVLK